MTPDLISALVDGGSAVIIIFMVVRFLDFITKQNEAQREADKKRDQQWQDFFTLINQGNDQKTDKIATVLDELVKLVTQHDTSTKEAIAMMVERTSQKTQSISKGRTQKGTP